MRGGPLTAFALTGAKAAERDTLLDIFATEPMRATDRPAGQTLIADENYLRHELELQLGRG
ncbi:hypothetical protein [Streptomyces sp. NPDC048442]|uniref:hypothetical protein n=1 Tax=Streptomyces sp. NPDC048442 TaxID=3154823 RepID=UPI0034272E29